MGYTRSSWGADFWATTKFEGPNRGTPKKISIFFCMKSLGNRWIGNVNTYDHRFSRDRRLKICWVKCATMLKIVLLDVHKRFQKYSN